MSTKRNYFEAFLQSRSQEHQIDSTETVNDSHQESASNNGSNQSTESVNIDSSKLPKILRGKYFSPLSLTGQNVTAKCKECSKQVKGSTNSTGNFRNHLRLHHSEKFKEMEADGTGEQQLAFKKPRQTLLGVSKISDEMVLGKVMDFILTEDLPFDTVNKRSFLDLIHTINPNVSMPRKTKLIQNLIEKVDVIREKLIAIFKEQSHVCTTADVWSCRGRSFLGVSVHFIDSQTIERKSYILAFEAILEKQDYKYIGGLIQKVHERYGLHVNKIPFMVTDGGSNMCKAFRFFGPISESSMQNTASVEMNEIDVDELYVGTDSDDDMSNDQNTDQALLLNDRNIEQEVEKIINELENESDMVSTSYSSTEIILEQDNMMLNVQCEFDNLYVDDIPEKQTELPKQFRCLSHLLNLAASVDLKKKLKQSSYGDVFQKALSKLYRFWYLIRKSAGAKRICETICGFIYKTPNDTRWNSLYDAILKIVEKPDLYAKCTQKILHDLRPKNFQKLLPAEIAMMVDYVACMQPVAIALDILQGDKLISLGYVLPTLFSMLAKVRDAQLKSSGFGCIMRDCLILAIQDRVGDYMRFEEKNKHLILSAILHPRFKANWIVEEEDYDFAIGLFLKEYRLKTINAPESNVSSDTSETEDDFYRTSRRIPNIHGSMEPTIIINEYLSQKCQKNMLLLAVGLENFPIIRKMFIEYNTTIPSSAPVERLFSKALIVFTPRRNRILSSTFEKVLLYKHNKDVLNK